MSKYMIIRLVQNMPVLSIQKIYNNAQVLRIDNLILREKQAIEKSAISFKEDITQLSTQFFCCILEADSFVQADSIAEQIFDTLIDSIDGLCLGISDSILRKSGIIICNNDIYYRVNASVNYPTVVFKNDDLPYDSLQQILFKQSPLLDSFNRFCNWQRMIKSESNIHMQILMYWFALEGVIKINENDIIKGRMLNVAGFISGNLGKYLDKEFIKLEVSKPNYRELRHKLESMLDNIRMLRNDTVHTGIETSSVPYEQQIQYLEVLTYISEELRCYLHKGIKSDISTKKEFWDKFPDMFIQEHKDGSFKPDEIFADNYFLNKINYIVF